MFDLERPSNRISVKLNENLSMYGVLPENWELASGHLKKDTVALSDIERAGVALLTAATISNSVWVGMVDHTGLSIVYITDTSIGFKPVYDSINDVWYMSSGILNAANAQILSTLGSAIVTPLERFLLNLDTTSDINQLFDWGFSGNAIEEGVVGRSSNITGVTITRAVGNPGQYTLAYTKATNVLTFDGGTGQCAYIIATTPVPYKMTLTSGDGVTKLDILVNTGSLPAGNTTDRIGIGMVGSTSVDQPANITGVTLVHPVGVPQINTIAYTAAGSTLTWGGGVAVAVSTGGYFLLTDTAGNTVVALVNSSLLPVGNQSDVNRVIHRCEINENSDDLLINFTV